MSADVAPRDLVAAWGGKSHLIDIDGPVHWVEFSSRTQRTTGLAPLVLVHGLGGSHLDWSLVGPTLASGRRVVALDLRGFGLSPGTRRTASVHANAHLLETFLDAIVREPAVLVGNSMGGMVSIIKTSRSPRQVAGLVLVDPSLPTPRRKADTAVAAAFLVYMTPGLGELSMRASRTRITPEQRVQQVIDLCFADSTRADPQFLDACSTLLRSRSEETRNEAAFLAAARSLLALLYRRRTYAEMMRSIRAPVLLINGEQDRLVPVEAASATAASNPTWQTAFLPGVGHTPQLEVPGQFVDVVQAWLASRVPRRAATP